MIPDRYTGLEEIESESDEARTRMNVYSDATLILSHGPLHGGSKFTEVVATKQEKPVLHVDLGVTSILDAVIGIGFSTSASPSFLSGPRRCVRSSRSTRPS